MLSYGVSRFAGGAYDHKPRGTWRLKRIYGIGAGNAERLPIIADTTVYVQFGVTKPLMSSPFIFGSGAGKQGFYGIQSMTF